MFLLILLQLLLQLQQQLQLLLQLLSHLIWDDGVMNGFRLEFRPFEFKPFGICFDCEGGNGTSECTKKTPF